MRQVNVRCSVVKNDDGSFGLELEIASLSRAEASQLGDALRDPIRETIKDVFTSSGVAPFEGAVQ